jgi:hypothetical protein
MSLRPLIAVCLLVVAGSACAEDDGEEFLKLMRQKVTREVAQKHIDNAANKWEGRVVCTPEEDREEARFQAVLKYFEEHPEEMWRPQRYLIIQGLRAAFPCHKS